jgi:hypothetical protein
LSVRLAHHDRQALSGADLGLLRPANQGVNDRGVHEVISDRSSRQLLVVPDARFAAPRPAHQRWTGRARLSR